MRGCRYGNTDAAAAKGKAVAFIDVPPPPPPLGSLGIAAAELESGNFEDWRKFKEAGLLDQSAMERKDREALLDKISRIEKELFDYQYNMGLLLIEKNNLVSKNEELGQEVYEAQEILKREQAAHIIALSEAGKREENLKMGLEIEKKCVIDLERALRDMHGEHSKIKSTSEATMTDVNARIEILETIRLEVEGKSHSANTKLAEADRKISELDRKLQDLETRESILKREHLTLTQEREAHESYFRKQKEDLLDWERKLQEAEQRLCDSRRALNEREEKLHETDRSCKQKESKLEELQQKIDLANATLKKMEEDISNQSADLDSKEKKFEAIRCNLELREKQLNEKDESLNAREKVELQNLLNEHKANLDAKMCEFELEMKQKRKSLEEEMESKRQTVDQKETEVNHLEVKLGKREQALEKKAERLKEKEKDVEEKVKALKGQEKCLKAEAKTLEAEKTQFNVDKEQLENLRDEIEVMRNDMSEQQKQIEEERTKLENAEKERSEYLRLQSNLKQEMENVRRQSQLIEKEAQDLKMERDKFEKDWEALDDKRATIDSGLKKLSEEKASFEKLRNSEEERLKKKLVEIEEYVKKETNGVKLEKESFEATMKQGELMLSQKVENEHRCMIQDFERKRENLDRDMLQRQEEWEKMVQEKERTFEEMRLREMKNISHLKEDAKTKMEEMGTERQHMEKERQELELNKKQLEETSIEISKDIEALDNLSKKLKNQREQLISERTLFGAFVEKIKRCKNCGDSAQEILRHDLQLPIVMGSSHLPKDSLHVQKGAKDELSPFSELSTKTSTEFGGQKSILRKCASIIFHLSPNKGIQHADDNENKEEGTSRAQTSANDEPRPSFELVKDSSKNLLSDVVREDNLDHALSVDDSHIGSEVEGIQEPEKSDLHSAGRKSGRKRRPGVQRTHSVKAVVEDAKAILGETSEGNNVDHANVARATNAQKRSRSKASGMTESEQDVEYSEGKTDSVTTGGRRKRRQTVASALPTPGQRRYNLRRHTVAGQGSGGESKKNDGLAHEGAAQPAPNPDDAPAQSLDFTVESERRLNLAQVSTPRSVEFSSERIVRFDTKAKLVDDNVGEAKSVEDTLLSEGEVNGTSENVDEDDNASIFHEKDEDDDVCEDDEDEYDHPGQASVGKKIWKFFTT